jgi:thiol-disulfide isomerase/thioredoxin
MKHKTRLQLVLWLVGITAFVAWFVVPSAFVHGVIIGLVGGVGTFVAGLLLLRRLMKKRLAERLQPPPLPTSRWDYSMELTDLDGSALSLSDSAGQVLVLNFWATWCAPCVVEIPSLLRLLAATADLDVRFAFITREDPAVVLRFVEKQGVSMPIYVLVGEPPECFRGRAIPATFVLDKTGLIAMRHFGAAKWDAESVVAFVRGLAATPPSRGSA